MIRQTITPDNEAHWLALRREDLTSTDIAALFGLSPYKTHFELWHEKKAGASVEFSDNERMLWGRRLQDAIAAGVADDLGLIVRPMLEYMRIPGQRIGSSFDWAIEGALETSPFYARFMESGPGILEVKNVDWLAFQRGWLVEADFVEAPAHIEVQTQHQQVAAGRSWSIIAALVGGNRYEILERLADPQVHAGILAAARDFWKSIDENNPPPPVMPDDAEAVIGMYQFAEPGKLLVAQDDAELLALVREYLEFKSVSNNAAEQAKVRQAEILQRIGHHEKVIMPDFNVSAGMIGPATVSYERDGYRGFRVTVKKPKPEKST